MKRGSEQALVDVGYYWERLGHKTLLAAKGTVQFVRPRGVGLTVFVAGMQRSGTNMLMDLLERSIATEVFHERDGRAFDNYRMREREVVRRLRDGSRSSVFVIKALCELDQISSLMADFAPAKVVWIVRDFRDAVSSALASFGNFGKQVARVAEDRFVDDWRAQGMSAETHELVRRLHHPAMSEASAAALIWYFRNVLFFEQQLERDERVMLVAYEELVRDPERICRRMFEFAGLNYSDWITRHVFSSSVRCKPGPDLEPGDTAVCLELTARFRERLMETAESV
jgi:hypothetical protein